MNSQILLNKIKKIEPLIDYLNDDKLTSLYGFLEERIENTETYVTFLGETSAGKSTIINGLIKEDVLPNSSSPTTGGIVEVSLSSDIEQNEYYVFNKDVTVEEVDKQTWQKLVKKPDANVGRLKLCIPHKNNNFKHVRIFDTPGYDSIVEEHEEILKEFLPNSDVIVYVVNYKIGIQDNDRIFLNFLKELIRPDVEVVLVINRCPLTTTDKNVRVKEIVKYANGILGGTIKSFIIPITSIENGENSPLPEAKEFWEYIQFATSTDERLIHLYQAFDSYINELFNMCDTEINNQYIQHQSTEDMKADFIKLQKETANKIRKAISLYIEPGFDTLLKAIPAQFEKAKENAAFKIMNEIEFTSTINKDEMIGYTNKYLLPHYLKIESDIVQNYIKSFLTDMNDKVDNYINVCCEEFNNEVTIRLNSHLEQAAKKVGLKIANKTMVNGLLMYFAKYGGAGGSKAGIANAASHILKKVGDFFGKTFSRETHNALKHFLAKVGATSVKAVGAAVTVVLEVLMIAIEYATWKPKLRKQVQKGLDEWCKNVNVQVKKDLLELKQSNIETINAIADNQESVFKEESMSDVDMMELKKYFDMCNEVRKNYE